MIQMEILKNNILTNFINSLIYDIAKEYVNNLTNYKSGDAAEIVLKYLDTSVIWANKSINICDSNLESQIKKMNRKEVNKFNKALNSSKKYKSLCNKLNFVFATIKEPELQNELFNFLYYEYVNNNKKINNIHIPSKMIMSMPQHFSPQQQL